MVRQLSAPDLADMLLEPLAGLPLLLGHTNTLKEAQDLNFLADSAAEMIQDDFPTFRFEEITLAFRQGVRGKWKQRTQDIVQVNILCLSQWLSGYQGIRAQAIQALQAVAEQEAETARQQQQDAAYKQQRPTQVAELAAGLAATGELPSPLDLGSPLFEWLWAIGAFQDFRTAQQYAELEREEAERLARKGVRTSRSGERSLSLADVLTNNSPAADSLRRRCRERLLREWLLAHNEWGTDLCTWLTELDTHFAARQCT